MTNYEKMVSEGVEGLIKFLEMNDCEHCIHISAISCSDSFIGCKEGTELWLKQEYVGEDDD